MKSIFVLNRQFSDSVIDTKIKRLVTSFETPTNLNYNEGIYDLFVDPDNEQIVLFFDKPTNNIKILKKNTSNWTNHTFIANTQNSLDYFRVYNREIKKYIFSAYSNAQRKYILATSSDAKSWQIVNTNDVYTQLDNHINLGYSSIFKKFFCNARYNEQITSTDLITWNKKNIVTVQTHLSAPIFVDNLKTSAYHMYVDDFKYVLITTDGINWNRHNIVKNDWDNKYPDFTLTGIHWNEDLQLFYGLDYRENKFYLSSDGITWDLIPMPDKGSANNWSDVVYLQENKTFLAMTGRSTGKTLFAYSSDGRDWKTVESNLTSYKWEFLRYVPFMNKLFAFTRYGTPQYVSSTSL